MAKLVTYCLSSLRVGCAGRSIPSVTKASRTKVCSRLRSQKYGSDFLEACCCWWVFCPFMCWPCEDPPLFPELPPPDPPPPLWWGWGDLGRTDIHFQRGRPARDRKWRICSSGVSNGVSCSAGPNCSPDDEDSLAGAPFRPLLRSLAMSWRLLYSQYTLRIGELN